MDLQHQLKCFNSQNPLGLKRVTVVTFLKNMLLFFCRTVRCIFFCFLSSWSQCNCWCFYLMYYQKYWEERQNQIIRDLNGGGGGGLWSLSRVLEEQKKAYVFCLKWSWLPFWYRVLYFWRTKKRALFTKYAWFQKNDHHLEACLFCWFLLVENLSKWEITFVVSLKYNLSLLFCSCTFRFFFWSV